MVELAADVVDLDGAVVVPLGEDGPQGGVVCTELLTQVVVDTARDSEWRTPVAERTGLALL